MGERYRPITLEEREITDGIEELRKSKGLTGCPDHKTVVDAQILTLRIGENTIFRLQELGDAIQAAARLAADAVREAERAVETATAQSSAPFSLARHATTTGSAAAVVIAILATIWKAKGWM